MGEHGETRYENLWLQAPLGDEKRFGKQQYVVEHQGHCTRLSEVLGF